MAKCYIISPTVALLSNITTDEQWRLIDKTLSYKSTEIQNEILRLAKNLHWKRTNVESYKTKLEELKTNLVVRLYTKQNDTEIAFRPGSIPHLLLPFKICIDQRCYPSFDPLQTPYSQPLPFQLRDYQEKSVEKLLAVKHGHVELSVGSGKTAILLDLVQKSGLSCAIIVPGTENFQSLTRAFKTHFPPVKIGQYGSGQKKLDKHITICIGKSLSLIKKDSKEWLFFRSLDMVVFDESHTAAVISMEGVCHSLFEMTPYRFFLSATQLRNNNETPRLESIIGKCVHSLGIPEAVRKGYISPHRFQIYSEVGCPPVASDNPLVIRREAFLNNEFIAEIIVARVISASRSGLTSLVLVDEVEQLGILAKKLKAFSALSIGYAHGETNKARLKSLDLPCELTGAKLVDKSVEEFNKGITTILAGTGCIHTGANLYNAHLSFNWYGTISEIKTIQGCIGRGIRKMESNPYYQDFSQNGSIQAKKECIIVDFDVDHSMMKKHLQKRIGFYEKSESSIEYIK